MRKFLTYICMTLILAGVGTWIMAGNITETGVSQRDLVKFLQNVVTMVNEIKADYNLLRGQNTNRALDNAKIGETVSTDAASASAIKTSGFSYVIDGIIYTKAEAEQTGFATAATQSTPSFCRYLFSINSAGTVVVTKGSDATPSASAYFPANPSGYAPFGGMLVLSSGTTGFVAGLHRATLTRSTSVIWYNLSYVNSGAGASTDVSTSDLSLSGL
jgi:hypothetical protein